MKSSVWDYLALAALVAAGAIVITARRLLKRGRRQPSNVKHGALP